MVLNLSWTKDQRKKQTRQTDSCIVIVPLMTWKNLETTNPCHPSPHLVDMLRGHKCLCCTHVSERERESIDGCNFERERAETAVSIKYVILTKSLGPSVMLHI